MSGRSFSVYLNEALLEWVDRKAEQENRSRSNYIEKVLMEKMRDEEELVRGETRRLRPLART